MLILKVVSGTIESGKLQVLCKLRENCKTLPREHLIGCQGVKMFLLKDPFNVLSLITI